MTTHRSETSPLPSDLLEAVLGLAAHLDLTTVLQRFVQAGGELTGARYAALNVVDAEGRSTTFLFSGVPGPIAEAIGRAPHSTGVFAEIPDDGVLLLDDLTQHPAFGGFPADHPPMGSFLGAPVRVRDAVYGHLYLADKPGRFDEEDARVVRALAGAAGVAIHNAQVYDAARRRERWMRAGQEITMLMLSGAEQEEALERIASAAREVAEADTAALVLPSLDDAWMMEIVDGDGAEELLGTVMPAEGRAMTVLRAGRGLVVDSLPTTRDLRVPALRRFGSAMYAPLQTDDRELGVLVLLRHPGRPPFDEADRETAEAFAAQAALALVLSEARHAQDVASLLDERERIARDLHDLAIQQLFATGMQLESLRQRALEAETQQAAPGTANPSIDPHSLAEILDVALDNVDSTVRQIRSIVHALRDPDADVGLVERLRREAALARTGLGFAPSLIIDLDGRVLGSAEAGPHDEALLVDRVDDDLADDVLAVVREGLANAARHARASSVTVRVSVTSEPVADRRWGAHPGGRVEVEVRDDGTGLPPDRERRSGTANLAARARRHGGTFELRPGEPTGTVLLWSAPL